MNLHFRAIGLSGHRCRLLRPWDGDANAAVRLHRRRRLQKPGSVTLGNKDTWKQYTFYLNDAYFGNRQNNGADFRISAGVGTTFYLDLVQVSTAQTGDFNADGTINTADYVVWRKGLGTTYTQNDYNIWRAHFGQTTGSASGTSPNAAVPEPRTLVMFVAALIGCSIPIGRRVS